MGKNILKGIVFILYVAVLAVMGMANISIRDAETNLASWVKRLGVDQIPILLKDPMVDVYVYHGGLAFVLISLIALLFTKISRRKNITEENNFINAEDRGKQLLPDWRIDEAMDYIAEQIGTDNETDIDKEYGPVVELMHAKIKTGELQTWGKRIERIVQSRPNSVTETLSTYVDQESFTVEDWRHRKLKPLEAGIPTQAKPQTYSKGRADDHIQFTDLHVNESQIKNIQWQDESQLSISEAARSLYGDLRAFDKRHWHVGLAEVFDDTEDGILTYFAICISLHAEIFGKRPPSNKLEKIDKAEWQRGSFKKEGNEFWYYHTKKPRYIEMVIYSSDLPSIFNILKSQNKLGI